MPEDRLALALAVRGLPPPWRGVFSEVVESTQTQARLAANAGAPDRSLFVADYQRAGHGRHGRSWLSIPGAGLLLSVVFREQNATARPWRFTMLASMSLVESIQQLLPEGVTAIKWPNDVMLGDRKVAGVLAETSWNGQELVAVVGVGVNVHSSAPDLPVATSLDDNASRIVDRDALLLTFVRHLDALRAEPEAALHARWQSRLWRRGQRIRLVDREVDDEVIILGAAADGSLLVRLPDGTQRRTSTGELLA